jgi:hypothetical protein
VTKTADFTDESYHHYQTAVHTREDTMDNGYRWYEGEWGGPYGDVWIGMGGKPEDCYTNLRLTMDGRSYSRRWEHMFGKKTLAKLAREFQEEIYIRSRLEYLGVDVEVAREFITSRAYGPAAAYLTGTELGLIRKYL